MGIFRDQLRRRTVRLVYRVPMKMHKHFKRHRQKSTRTVRPVTPVRPRRG